ncbi:MAG: bifunctional UDP-3-O-[3-hydroxymyristoyl] N-acetylglucosamine deacetylase/3-hydroxyacyl-ACP dehydratase [Methylococcaceae bacterium]|nr:bifunctional UDP-3-O-[3-hydroxymyristoyl] N-acetylglucosamine deacetylase/3-hydroxyacyl-ACP dehydratase [Prolixibacteraceae bacterium]
MAVKQKTLAKEFSISGKGLHTSCQVSMTFKPAPVNHGFKFQRVDLANQPIISAHVDFVVDTARGTVIENQGARISTIEHSLAALTGMDLDNVLIEIDNEEVPILDGSSRYFVEAIEKAGIVEQEANRDYFVVTEKMVYKNEKTGSEMILLPDSEYSVNVLISFNSTVLNNQYASMNSLSEFKSEIANCRTFVFLHELEFLLKNNLVKGGDVDNAIIIIDRPVSQDELDRLADLFNHERVEIKSQGILNNIDLQYDNECARHKLLDVIGDLALAGKRIKGRVIATKPGHSVNTAFAKMISKTIHKEECRVKAPLYDANTPTLMDVNKIKSLLPHRYPFLLVDKVIDIQEDSLVGIKNVTANEPFFQGHFPDEPVMPGVLLVEAMAQAGGIFVLRNLEGKYSTYFMKIDNVKFRKKVVPGDTIVFKVVLTSPIRRGIAEMRGLCYVGDSIVAEGDYMAQIVKIN